MKTAEEWLKEQWFDFLDTVEPQEVIVRGDDKTEDFIKAIQLDAYEKGIRDAAEAAKNALYRSGRGYEAIEASAAALSLLTKPKDKE